MPIHKPADAQTDVDAADVQPEAAPPAQQTAFTDEGAIPKVGSGANAHAPTASEQAFGEHAELDAGMYEPAAFKAACERQGKPDKWHDHYAMGHTHASGWIQPYEGRYAFEFHLKKATSASQAVKDFVKGPTIADYRAIGVALEMDELRDDLGDHTFDRLFGSKDGDVDAAIPGAQRLAITSSMYTIPFAAQMKAIAADAEAKKQAVAQELEQPVAKQREEPKEAKIEETPVAAVQTEEAKREVV